MAVILSCARAAGAHPPGLLAAPAKPKIEDNNNEDNEDNAN